MNFKELEKMVSDVYLVADPGIVKTICAAVIAHRLPSETVWIVIVAPSGGGKTEFITALNDVQGIIPLSSLTPNTFISGQKRGTKTGDPSLLYRIKNGILTFKDFTTILSLQPDARGEIIGQLREIYDGSYSKSFGTGETIDWKGKIGLIAGVTDIIHLVRQKYAAMGERLVMYSLIQPDRLEVGRRAMKNTKFLQEKRPLLRQAFKQFLDSNVRIPDTLPDIGDELREEILKLADLSTRARSPVERDWHSTVKDIIFVHAPEMPTRFSSQLTTLAAALSIIDDGILSQESKNILYKITLDSITFNRRQCLQELTRYEEVETAGLATKLNYPTQTVRRWLEELNALEVVERKKGGSADRWRLRESYRPTLEKFEGIKILDHELIESSAKNAMEFEQPVPDEEISD